MDKVEYLVRPGFQFLLHGLDALEALEQAHVIHRDISPGNFLFSWSRQRWVLTDFEYACMADSEEECNTSAFYGTQDYVAPEIESPSGLQQNGDTRMQVTDSQWDE